MIGSKRVMALIPARGGSKGVPGKNIHPIGGRPLLRWTIDAARGSRCIDRLILSSDDARIVDIATQAGCEAPFLRSAELSTDEASSIDVAIDAIQRVPGYDVIVLLQPTSPLRDASDIDGVLEAMEACEAPACVSVRPAQEHPYLTFRLDAGGRLVRFSDPPAGASLRRQDLPQAWCPNGAVFAARVDWIQRIRGFLSPETVAYPMPAERSLDIDTLADLERFERALAASTSRVTASAARPTIQQSTSKPR